MDYEVVIKPIVIFDLEEVIDYYNLKANLLGQRFYDQFLEALTTIGLKPFTFSYLKEPIRRSKIPHFPYKMYYVVEYNLITVLGIAHEKRSNTFIRRKLKN